MDPDAENQRFCDVYFDGLKMDPIGTVKEIYQHFDCSVSPEFEGRMKMYLRENPPGVHGKHTYSPEMFNLTAEQIKRDLSDYAKRFGLAV